MIEIRTITDLHDLEYEVIEFDGELDTGGMHVVEKELMDYVESFSREVLIFDFTHLKYINSDCIGMIVTILAKLGKKNKKLVLVHLLPHVADVCEAVGLMKLMQAYPSRAQAIADIKKHT